MFGLASIGLLISVDPFRLHLGEGSAPILSLWLRPCLTAFDTLRKRPPCPSSSLTSSAVGVSSPVEKCSLWMLLIDAFWRCFISIGGGGGAFLGATNSLSSSGRADPGLRGLLIGSPSAVRVPLTLDAIGLDIVPFATESFRCNAETDPLRSWSGCAVSPFEFGTSFLEIILPSESSLAGLSNAEPCRIGLASGERLNEPRRLNSDVTESSNVPLVVLLVGEPVFWMADSEVCLDSAPSDTLDLGTS